MTRLAEWSIHIDKIDQMIGAVIAVILAILVAWQKFDVTHTVLAYAYSIGDSYYSGQIRLDASEGSMESVEKEMVGHKLSIHYNPTKPEISIFLKHKVRGRLVVPDRRTSLWSWFD
jgi:hypothetical protein